MSDEQLTKKERQELNRQEKNNRKANEERAESFKKIGMAIGLVVIVVGIVWAVKASRPSADEVIDVHPDPIEGPADAAIVIKEYSDFECPACQALHPVLQDIRKEYNGQVRFQYNDFPLSQHKYSTTAAVGAECAFQQDKFFDYHDLLFDNQETWAAVKTKDEATEIFRGYAEELSLDMTAFDSCTTGPDAADRVNEDYAEGISLGVNSTPTVFVNGERVTEVPFSKTIREAIERAIGAGAQSTVSGEGEDDTSANSNTSDVNDNADAVVQ